MLFHSWTFILFFIIAYAVFLGLKKDGLRVFWLLVCSYVFYGWWNPLYLLLITWVVVADYSAVALMEKTGRKKLFLVLSVVNSLGALAFFKYGDFVLSTVGGIAFRLGAESQTFELGILLPVGISFFVFQSMSYTIDFYRGRIERERSIIRYAAFVSFFPQLVAGPIERAGNLLPQMRVWKRFDRERAADGAYLFLCGMFKKVALADYFAMYSDRIFASPERFGAGDLLAASLAFCWQIYFDFSGYTDMARGVARILGVDLMQNFRSPYMAKGMRDFWHRWHISLSTWFRDYLYLPLGGNRHGKGILYRNIIIVMLLSGLWHGPAWNFVIWGGLHALLYLGEMGVVRVGIAGRTPDFVKKVVVSVLLVLTWIPFRAQSAGDIMVIFRGLGAGDFSLPGMPLFMLALIAGAYGYEWMKDSGRAGFVRSVYFKAASASFILLYLLLFASHNVREFIYFQF